LPVETSLISDRWSDWRGVRGLFSADRKSNHLQLKAAVAWHKAASLVEDVKNEFTCALAAACGSTNRAPSALIVTVPRVVEMTPNALAVETLSLTELLVVVCRTSAAGWPGDW
jgi:hypothetical protein